MLHCFTKGVSVDVSYLKINDVLEYNPPYMESDFTCNQGPAEIFSHCPWSSKRNIFKNKIWPLTNKQRLSNICSMNFKHFSLNNCNAFRKLGSKSSPKLRNWFPKLRLDLVRLFLIPPSSIKTRKSVFTWKDLLWLNSKALPTISIGQDSDTFLCKDSDTCLPLNNDISYVKEWNVKCYFLTYSLMFHLSCVIIKI